VATRDAAINLEISWCVASIMGIHTFLILFNQGWVVLFGKAPHLASGSASDAVRTDKDVAVI
jgi:hypothetical protein